MYSAEWFWKGLHHQKSSKTFKQFQITGIHKVFLNDDPPCHYLSVISFKGKLLNSNGAGTIETSLSQANRIMSYSARKSVKSLVHPKDGGLK